MSTRMCSTRCPSSAAENKCSKKGAEVRIVHAAMVLHDERGSAATAAGCAGDSVSPADQSSEDKCIRNRATSPRPLRRANTLFWIL
eukprot:698746-Pyramimonas_sp.AAC.1